MEIKYKKQFLKELSKLPRSYQSKVEALVFESIPNEEGLQIMERVSKMKGHDNYYKIRVGDYRIGLTIDGDLLEFKRVLHRREIYRYFP